MGWGISLDCVREVNEVDERVVGNEDVSEISRWRHREEGVSLSLSC